MKIRLSISQKLFLSGLLLHFVYLCILRISPSDFQSMYLADSSSLFMVTDDVNPDTRSYIESADNFLSSGVFGEGQNPDYHRTIGYPIILVFFKYLFGNNWYLALVLFQCILAAVNYPVIYSIGGKLFGNQSKTPLFAAISAMLLGTFFTSIHLVSTDLVFVSVFLLGICFSLTAIEKKNNYLFVFLAILTISFAGMIRPLLILYFIPGFLLLYWYAKKLDTGSTRHMKFRIYLITLALLFGCNFSSFRNYYNYGMFIPTDVLGHNLFDYSTKFILRKEDKNESYLKMKMLIDNEDIFTNKYTMQKAFFLETISKYPLSAIQYWTEVAVNHMLSPHWQRIGRSYGYYKRPYYHGDKLILKGSSMMKKIHYSGMAINFLFLILPLTFFLLNTLNKDRLFVIVVLSFIATLIGPTLIAGASERMRLPIEGFILLIAAQQLGYYSNKLKEFTIDNLSNRHGTIKIFSKTIEYSIK